VLSPKTVQKFDHSFYRDQCRDYGILALFFAKKVATLKNECFNLKMFIKNTIYYFTIRCKGGVKFSPRGDGPLLAPPFF
jgi:hypothetical protein